MSAIRIAKEFDLSITIDHCTDGHPATPVHFLALCAGMAASFGLPEDVALRAITINSARALGIADRVGSLEVGKDADIVVWMKNPITAIGARAVVTVVDGKIVHRI